MNDMSNTVAAGHPVAAASNGTGAPFPPPMSAGCPGPGFVVRRARGSTTRQIATVGRGVQVPGEVAPTTQQRPGSTHHEREILTFLDAEEAVLGSSPDEGLRRLAWNGLPEPLRAAAWRLLTGTAPTARGQRAKDLGRKRSQYRDFVASYFRRRSEAEHDWLPQERAITHQLSLDLPRHKLAVFHAPAVATRIERVLFIWSLRHPAVGYVQGMDDIAVVFLIVFLAERVPGGASVTQVATRSVEELGRLFRDVSPQELDDAEADCYWCAGAMFSWVQDHFVVNQPRVHQLLHQLERLVEMVDPALSLELEELGISFAQFSFQWVHCLLVRELTPRLSARLWDTYLSIGADFATFHVYVCAALLLELKPHVAGRSVDVVIRVLQAPASAVAMSDAWLETLIAQAYFLRLRHPLNAQH